MSAPSAGISSTRARGALLLLAAFLASLLLTWSHPLDHHGAHEHGGALGSTQVAADGPDHDHHLDHADCTLCAAAHTPVVAPDLAPTPAPIDQVVAASSLQAALARSAFVLSHAPRAPPV